MTFDDAVSLADQIRNRQRTSVEVTEHVIARIEQHAALNAVVVRDVDRALRDARAADAVVAAGQDLPPLHGVPMTVKESFNVEGLPTTWGRRDVEHVAPADAEVVRRLRAAGAVIVGKTNVPVMLSDFQTYNPRYGTTNNPWDPQRTPGGSSGGAAAALAAGLTALEYGSDLGGSIRNPAHFCGVYGHKPTFGVVPMAGHALPDLPLMRDLVVVGPLARSARDLALALQLTCGPDRAASRAWALTLPPPRARSLKGLRVAVWPSAARAPVDDEVAGKVQASADALAQKGAVVSDVARPPFDLEEAHRAYVALTQGASLMTVSDAAFAKRQAAAAALDPEDDSYRAFVTRTMALDHRAWLAQDAVRQRLRAQWRRFFEEWDILLCPIFPCPAFPHDHRPMHERTLAVHGKPQPYFMPVFWAALASAAYLPSTVFPAGRSAGGLPIGLQAIGAEYDDLTTIAFAGLMDEVWGGFQAPPP